MGELFLSFRVSKFYKIRTEFSLSKTSRMFGIMNVRSRFDIMCNTVNRIFPTRLVLRQKISNCAEISLDVEKIIGQIKKGEQIIKLLLKVPCHVIIFPMCRRSFQPLSSCRHASLDDRR